MFDVDGVARTVLAANRAKDCRIRKAAQVLLENIWLDRPSTTPGVDDVTKITPGTGGEHLLGKRRRLRQPEPVRYLSGRFVCEQFSHIEGRNDVENSQGNDAIR